MDTKLRRLSKRQEEILLGAGLFLVLIFLNLTYIYACYAGISEAYYYVEQKLKDSCFKAAVILGILTVVCSIGIGFILHDYLKRGPLKSNFKISKPDKIWTEINVFLLAVCILNYFRAFPAFGREIYIWGYVLIDSYDIVQYLTRLSFYLILLIPSLFLAVRKICLGIGKKTCFRAETREPFREGKEVVF